MLSTIRRAPADHRTGAHADHPKALLKGGHAVAHVDSLRCRAAASTLAAARQTGASRGSRGLCSRGLCSHWDLWPSCILTVAVVPLAGDGGSATYSARRPVSARGRRGTRASWRYDEQPSGGEHGRGIERSCGPTPPSHRARETRGLSASSTVAVCTRSAESAHTPPDAVLSDQQSSI